MECDLDDDESVIALSLKNLFSINIEKDKGFDMAV
jgi:hypothetical protein